MSQNTLRYLKTNSGKKGEGMPVLRNPQYYFKEGFCWSLINGTRSKNDLKFRLSAVGVYDVGGMSLHSVVDSVTHKFIVCIGNSDLISRYTESFLNFTVNFQINDARQIPIIIPTKHQLKEFEILFNFAYMVKQAEFSNQQPIDTIKKQLTITQQKIDDLVKILYNLV